jgi:16S rRNA (cytidine1402-2'-O)-methyltransferase
MSTLYLVATPIGNLEDFSPRAQRILKEVSRIAAEDTRHSRKLLSHFDIHTPLTSYFDHSNQRKLDSLLADLHKGDLALISDAGMPGINDPGYPLVRAALDAGHIVSPVPGPSAPIAALAASGLPSDQFLYLGYPARKSKERQDSFRQVANLPYTLIWLESPHRLTDSLEDLHAILGERQVAVAAEMTKKFERFFRGTLSEAITHFQQEPVRGEFTIVCSGAEIEQELWDEAQVNSALSKGLETNQPPSQLARQVASLSGWPRRQVYALLQEIQKSSKKETL